MSNRGRFRSEPQRFVRAHLAHEPDRVIVARDGDVLVQVPYHVTFPHYGDLLSVTRRKDCNAWVMLGIVHEQ